MYRRRTRSTHRFPLCRLLTLKTVRVFTLVDTHHRPVRCSFLVGGNGEQWYGSCCSSTAVRVLGLFSNQQRVCNPESEQQCSSFLSVILYTQAYPGLLLVRERGAAPAAVLNTATYSARTKHQVRQYSSRRAEHLHRPQQQAACSLGMNRP